MKKTPQAAPRPDDPDRAQKAGPLPRAADRIRSSAQDLFYHQGIRAVGVDAIVAEAGVTTLNVAPLAENTAGRVAQLTALRELTA